MKFEVFQDEKGNLYKLTTEVEQLMSEALYRGKFNWSVWDLF